MSGYIKLYRATCDHPLFKQDMCYLGAWSWLLMKVAWKPHHAKHRKTLTYVLARGQMPGSRAYLADQWGWTEKRVRTFLSALEKHGMIEISQLEGQRLAIISVCNYSKYQSDEIHKGQEGANNGPTMGHTEEGKELKEKNTTSSARETEIEGLNGSTEMYVGWLAEWLSPFAPDREAARQILVSNIGIYGSPKVQAGMVELKTQITSGDKPKNIVKAFSAFVKNASTDAKPRTLPKLDREDQINDGYFAKVMMQPVPQKLIPVLD